MRRQYGVRVQVGGSDQWGNILAGTDLMRRMLGGPEEPQHASSAAAPAAAGSGEAGGGEASGGGAEDQVYGLTFPLLLKADGTKFGKSEDGALWLNADMLSPYKFYQFLFKTTDAGRF
jgi:tyrosyl-tRNA synthetase